MTKVRLYVDALNFYYSVARRYEIKWIDLGELFTQLIRSKVLDGEIEKLILFASEVLERRCSRTPNELLARSAAA